MPVTARRLRCRLYKASLQKYRSRLRLICDSKVALTVKVNASFRRSLAVGPATGWRPFHGVPHLLYCGS